MPWWGWLVIAVIVACGVLAAGVVVFWSRVLTWL
jgi:hypothetical protein